MKLFFHLRAATCSNKDYSNPGLPMKPVNGNGKERWNKSS